MKKTEKLLYHHIVAELTGLKENVISNHDENISNRRNNPFLLFQNKDINKYMALSRSVDSQLGNRMQRIIFYIARMRYGEECVPNIVEINITDKDSGRVDCILYSVSCDLPCQERKSGFNPFNQCVYFDKNFTEEQIKEKLKIKKASTSFKRNIFKFDGLSKETIDSLLEIKKDKSRYPVDLLFFETIAEPLNNANVFEIKLGGNLDTKNAGGNEGALKISHDLFVFLPNHSSYFATCYGECSHSVGKKVEDLFGADAICNNRDFWKKVIPEDKITYEKFIDIYAKAFKTVKIERALKEL